MIYIKSSLIQKNYYFNKSLKSFNIFFLLFNGFDTKFYFILFHFTNFILNLLFINIYDFEYTIIQL
jgi:hypothetical protein